MSNPSELLIGLSVEELEALADGQLAPTAQAQLDDLSRPEKYRRCRRKRKRNSTGFCKRPINSPFSKPGRGIP